MLKVPREWTVKLRTEFLLAVWPKGSPETLSSNFLSLGNHLLQSYFQFNVSPRDQRSLRLIFTSTILIADFYKLHSTKNKHVELFKLAVFHMGVVVQHFFTVFCEFFGSCKLFVIHWMSLTHHKWWLVFKHMPMFVPLKLQTFSPAPDTVCLHMESTTSTSCVL